MMYGNRNFKEVQYATAGLLRVSIYVRTDQIDLDFVTLVNQGKRLFFLFYHFRYKLNIFRRNT
jgi:hypothetical protein